MLPTHADPIETADGSAVFADAQTLTTRDHRGEPPATAQLVRAFRELIPVRPPAWTELSVQWQFALGDPDEGLNTSLSRLPPQREPISLPHRTLDPDTPYWYVAEVEMPEPSVLEIGADDGAQLYVDGEQIPVQGDYFSVPASRTATNLVIRVLNKAMHGGLEWVRVASRPDFDRFQREAERRSQLAALVRKARLLLAPTEAQISAALKAVRDDDVASLLAAQQQFSGLPLTLVGPYLQTVAADRMNIVWETDEPCVGVVEWGEVGGAMGQIEARSDDLLHVAELENLKPDTGYRYRIRSGCVVSPQYTFQTLPEAGPFAFTVWSDSHIDDASDGCNDVFRQNIHAMRRLPIAFSVGTGDLVVKGHHREPWLRFFETLMPLASVVPTMLLGGNHDYDGCFEDLRSVYFDRYVLNGRRAHYFAWTVSNARFVALEPNLYFPTGIPADSEQYRWFRHELESPEWKRATWRFVFLHQPPYSQGWAEYHGIDFIVAGHTHNYERLIKTYGSQTVHLLVLGGAGGGMEDAPMSEEPVMDRVIRRHHFGYVQIDGRKVTFEAVATDTRLLDRFEVTK
jgi:hypothetical protein